MSSSCEVRLLRELKEIQCCPIANVTVSPIDDGANLREWHGNIRGNEEDITWANLVVHFRILFPVGYPNFPPRVSLFTFVPHVNLVQHGDAWDVCLDMLTIPAVGGLTIPYQHWTSAFSVKSILLQMTSFILAEGQPIQVSAGGPSRAYQEAERFVCRGCGHCMVNNITPVFPDEQLTKSCPLYYPSVEVDGVNAKTIQTKMYERKTSMLNSKSDHQQLSRTESPPPMIAVPMEIEAIEKPKASSTSTAWQVVQGKRKFNPVQMTVAIVNEYVAAVAKSQKTIELENSYEVLNSGVDALIVCSECNIKKPAIKFTKSQTKRENPKCMACIEKMESTKGNAPSNISDKNFAKRQRKRTVTIIPEKQATDKKKESSVTPTKSTSSSKTNSPPQPSKMTRGNGNEDDASETSLTLFKAEWESSVKRETLGLFGKLSRDTVSAVICSFLNVKEILSFGTTCKGACLFTDDWWVWKRLFLSKYPRSAIKPVNQSLTSSSDSLNWSWKHAFILEANGLCDELRCFHSFATKNEDILGIPIEYTINPKTSELDYITSTFDVISYSSYRQDGIRRTVWGEKFTEFLPLYLDRPHFLKALDILLKLAVKIAGNGRSIPVQARTLLSSYPDKTRETGLWIPRSKTELAMSMLLKLMNTQAVLISDKGVALSEAALSGYCQVHRLLLGLIQEFPALQLTVNRRLGMFLKDPSNRTKAHVPNLGDLYCTLSVSNQYSWKQMALPIFQESLDRSVLWSCTRDPSLANVIPGDETRIDRVLAASVVSLRLSLFQCSFINMLVQGGGSTSKIADCIDRYDLFQGRPPSYIKRHWRETVSNILALSSWPQYFNMARIPIPDKKWFLSVLEKAVGNSKRKGYHSDDTIFQNVMKSGVSRILLKGETYSAAPNVKRVRLQERWKFDGGVIYLDASCLIYNFNKECIGLVDYRHTQWYAGCPRPSEFGNRQPLPKGAKVCVRHSGDVISNNNGEHTIDIDLNLLPTNVASLFFTVSAWTTDLRAIMQPSAHLFDVDADVEMCRYKHEDSNTGDKTAVIMCQLYRDKAEAGGMSKWKLTSIGHVGYGRADNYYSIEKDIDKILEGSNNGNK